MLSYRKHSLAFSRHDEALIRATAEHLPQSVFRMIAAEFDHPKQLLRNVEQHFKDRPPDAASQWGIPPAIYFGYFGKPKLALEALRSFAFDATNTRLIWAPIFKETRRLPEFKQLVIDLKMVDFWRKSGKWGDFCQPTTADDFECH